MATDINFTITIDGTMVAEDPIPRPEAQKKLLEQVRRDWEPEKPEKGEEVTVIVEVEYEQSA